MQKLWKYKLDHILFWIITVGFHVYTRLHFLSQAGVGLFLGEIVIRNSLLVVVIYTNSLLLIPKLLEKKKYAGYIISLVSTLFCYAILKNIHDVFNARFLSGDTTNMKLFDNTFYNFSIALFYLAFSVGLQLSKAWFFQREQLRKIELEKVNTELAYLKNQINPHFLFNSLNTVYFQIDKNNAEARNTLSKFSEMLRFQLYECNGNEISLGKEINYLKNYVDLQRVRKGENYTIQFNTTGELRNITIAPLLLIPFVENAFKHVSHFADRTNEISIEIERKENRLYIDIINTKEENQKKEPGGIGLKNAKRRLEIQYPDQHSLTLEEKEKKFEVHLTLHLHETELSDR